MEMQFLIALPLLLPLLSAFVTALCVHYRRMRNAMSIILALLLFINIVTLGVFYIDGGRASFTLVRLLPDLAIAFHIEPMGLIFAAIASFLWVITSLYSAGYLRASKEVRQSGFVAFMTLAIGFTLGIAFAANLLTLFIFYELLTLCTYPLVTHSRTEEARRAGRTYLLVLMGTSMGLFFPAILLIWHMTGTLDFRIGGIFSGNDSAASMGILLFLMTYGIAKAALMPVHRWLPAAMVAPTPVSALLHAVAVVKAGVFTLLKIIVYIFGIDTLQSLVQHHGLAFGWLFYAAALTVVLASLIALRQDSIKRMLAYSTVSQLATIIMAASLFTPKAITAAMLHLIVHAFSKITLFFAAGSLYTSGHISTIRDINGAGRTMRLTLLAFTLGSLSLIGIPPAAGFISKYYLLDAALDAQAFTAIAVIILSSLLNAAYLLPLIVRAFWGVDDSNRRYSPQPLSMKLALVILCAAIIVVFLFSQTILQFGKMILY
jgi:multicomponent Na+:H+ antiporter subunit D